MADEKKPAGDKPAPASAPAPDPVAEIIWLLIVAMLVMYALNGITTYFGNSNSPTSGWSWRSLTPKGLVLSSTRPISSLLNPIGSKFVVTSNSSDLLDSPGGNKISTKHLGDKGTIVGGPVTTNGVKYWKVKFEDGKEGWIPESDIASLPQKKTPMTQISSLINTPVETNKETKVFSSPGENQIATKPQGTSATILEGPLVKDGVKYWHVKFEDGTTGWVNESDLDSMIDGKRTPLSKIQSLIGETVATNKNGARLYDKPGGEVIGTLNNGISGKIVEGPILVDGVRYYHIKFDNGTEGWVSENDLDYVQDIEPSIFIKILSFVWKFVSLLKYILIIFCIFAVGWITYLYKSIVKLRNAEREVLYPSGIKDIEKDLPMMNPKWEAILKQIESKNSNDWRQAIIEADIMLNDLLGDLHLPGDTMGEKLKAVERSDFTTIDDAWEAHKFRNFIAHEGSDFQINEHQVKRVIGLYKSVFEEFGIVEKMK